MSAITRGLLKLPKGMLSEAAGPINETLSTFYRTKAIPRIQRSAVSRQIEALNKQAPKLCEVATAGKIHEIFFGIHIARSGPEVDLLNIDVRVLGKQAEDVHADIIIPYLDRKEV